MEGTMKSAIYYGIHDVRMEEKSIPKITEKDILVKVLRAGICGSDTGAWIHGGEPTGIFPGNPFGHELVGRVVEKGKEVGDDINIDDIVFIEPLNATNAGTIMCDMYGGFGEYVKVENARIHKNVYVLDKNIDLDEAVLIEPLCVGTKAAICMNPQIDDKVVVLGAGTIGLSAAAALIARGMKNVTVVDQNDWRLDKARELGAKVINTAKEDLNEKLIEYYGEAKNVGTNMQYVDPKVLQQFIEFTQKAGMNLSGKKPDVDLFVDAAGAFPLLEQCFNNAKHNAKFSIVAVYGRKLEFAGGNFIKNEPVIRGSQAYNHEVIMEVIDHIVNKKTPIKTIVTSKFKHDDFVEAIDTASKGDHNIKVIIDYEQ